MKVEDRKGAAEASSAAAEEALGPDLEEVQDPAPLGH